MEHSEVKSDNARNVILSYNDKIYYVNSVNVAVKEGVDKLKAIFHAKRASDNTPEDLRHRNQPRHLQHANGVRKTRQARFNYGYTDRGRQRKVLPYE